MSQNPYQAPGASGQFVGIRNQSIQALRSVATAQKGLIFSILAYLIALAIMIVIAVVMRSDPSTGFVLLIIPRLVYAVAAISAFVFTIMLAVQVMHPVAGVLVALLTCVPCLGLIVLVAINQQAISILKRNGIQVGFFGADMSQFDRLTVQQQQPGQGEDPFG